MKADLCYQAESILIKNDWLWICFIVKVLIASVYTEVNYHPSIKQDLLV